IAHELLLPIASCRDVGGEKVVLPMDFEAMAGKEKQRRVAKLNCPVEGQKRLAHGASRLVLTDEHPKAKFFQRFAERTRITDRPVEPWQILVAIVAKQQRHAVLGLGRPC